MELLPSLLPHAIAVALSPMPIAALILILLSNNAKINSLAFLLGWMSALFINVGAFMWIFDKPIDSSGGRPEILVLLNIFLGIVLIVLALKEWLIRPRSNKAPKMPKWMKVVEKISPVMSFLIAFGLVTFNAKNTVIDISAGVLIGQSTSSAEEALLPLTIYVLVASITIIIPVLGFLLFGDRLNKSLGKIKSFLVYYNSYILFGLFLILGIDLIYKALK